MANTTSLLLSLHNAAEKSADQAVERPAGHEIKPKPNHDHLSFHLGSSNEKPAPPVSLLARIGQETYVLLPNASTLVSVSSGNLLPATEYHVRIVAPMVDDHGKGIVQLEGLWLSKGGKLLRVEGSLLSEEYADEDALHAQSDQIGERHRLGLSDMIKGSSRNFNAEKILRSSSEVADTSASRKKTLEILTDCPGSFGGRLNGTDVDSTDGLLVGETGWEYLLGEMFGVDHVGVSVDGMCLTHSCIDGTGQPTGIGDVFFRRQVKPGTNFELRVGRSGLTNVLKRNCRICSL